MDFAVDIKGRTLEYYDDAHIYLVDGIIVPSITSILKKRFSAKYDGIPAAVLTKAAEAGTAVHEAIETYINTGHETPIPEVAGFKRILAKYQLKVVESELPVVLESDDGTPIAAGRLDLVVKQGDELGGADIKRTARLDREYLRGQLNMYRIAYRQSYGAVWGFIGGVHLRDNIHNWEDIPIDEDYVKEIINDFFREEKMK